VVVVQVAVIAADAQAVETVADVAVVQVPDAVDVN
jgi:hypothetical protein